MKVHIFLWILVIAATILFNQHVNADNGQFYGGSMSYSLRKIDDETSEVTIELITGWILGKGPCGAGCNKSDIGRSTRTTRPQVLQSDPHYLGEFSVEYFNETLGRTVPDDIASDVESTYNETVIAISENAQWEQELLHFKHFFKTKRKEIDISFEGHSWRKLAELQVKTSSNVKWHFQTKISTAIRSDTNKTNKSPKSFARPFYRIKLGKLSEIIIPAVDEDNDFIKCDMSQFVEGGDISSHPPPHVTVNENCTIFVDARTENNFTDDTWIAVPVNVRDYNRKNIQYGDNPYLAASYSLSTTAVQFLVQVLANLVTPEFVNPTREGNHVFIMYADTTWRTKIYAEGTENASISYFTAFGIQQENFNLSGVEADRIRPFVKYSTMSWKPSTNEIGRHIACVSVTDNTGVDSAEQRCFILEVQADAFKHTTKIIPGKPYFVDIPSPQQFVDCKIQATCVVAIYVKSDVELKTVTVTKSFIDKYSLGPIQQVIHNGESLYQVDLSFEHSSHGKENICFKAEDINGGESENVCIQSQIEPPDPCVSAPCLNSATCERDKDTGGFVCLCLPNYTGTTCSEKNDPCKPDPCVLGQSYGCMNLNNILCYCKPGFAGPTCAENINDCNSTSCNGHGSCKDKVNGFDCECFDRYNGTHCENDTCPSEKDGVMSCPADGCTPGLCSEYGLCFEGGHCSCPRGFNGTHCRTRICNIPITSDLEITSPSVEDGSKLICYTQGDTILPCHIRTYLAVKSPTTPNVYVNTTGDLESLISVQTAQKLSVIPGISNMYVADVRISGRKSTAQSHFVCIHAAVGNSESSTCYELSFIANPEDDPTTLAFKQKDVFVKFVQPTLKDRSRILCKSSEQCRILLYTSISSNRSICNSSSSAPSNASGRCDADDKDNDEDDSDTAAKSNDPCCQDVISSTPEVTVYPAHARGPSCVSEASFTFPTSGKTDICFQSAKENFQQLCYEVDVFDTSADPCTSSPCQNNGHCFHTDQNKFTCLCPDGYTGDKCERGPCQAADNNCQNDAYCQTNDRVATCICKAGFSGSTCNEGPSSKHNTNAEFTDTAKPTMFTCVLNQRCSMALILTGPNMPAVSAGYVHPSLLLDEIETVDRLPIQNSYQTNIRLKPRELGIKDLCIQTIDTSGINKDELCIQVKVISDVISIYGFQDRPHFIEPSLPTNTEVECKAGGPCHILYHVTPGKGNENDCVTFHLKAPDGFIDYHLYSSCATCKPGDPSNGNCTVDVSVVSQSTDIHVQRGFCLSVALVGSASKGEERCFNLTITDPSENDKKGCQTLECKNRGFCDGHIPNKATCFCPKGFSGYDCGRAEVDSPLSGSQKQTFIGDLALPVEIKCILNTRCQIPFQIVSKSGSTPIVSLGYVDPRIPVYKPTIKASGATGTVFEGEATADPKEVGVFKVCIQTSDSSTTEDESCVTVDVISSAAEKTDQTKPFFLPPTLSSDSTVLCEVNKSCHFDMHFTKGDNFGFTGKCPTLTETSPTPVIGVYIFKAESGATDCVSDVNYIPPEADGEHRLCVQVELPGKKGETICYTIKIVSDVQNEVISPCRGFTCQNGGKCVADFTPASPEPSCICKAGFEDDHCGTVASKVTDLPGIENLNVSASGNQHFDVFSAIPREVKCEVNQDCCINIPYHGEKDKPPITGYVDSRLSVTRLSVLTSNSGDSSLYISPICVNGTTGGPYRVCQQTTTTGFKDGTNVDELCFNITIEPESKNHSTSGPHFTKTLPDGSSVVCKPNIICHNPVITAKQSTGNCSQTSECGDGEHGVHVFQTSLVDDVCVTDVAVKTGSSGPLQLCISSGSRGEGEETHLKIEVENSSSFGPCQKLHCQNGGTCMAEEVTTAVCRCPPGFTGSICETDIDECSTGPCKDNGTCIDGINNYTCICVDGYTGYNCEIDIDECSTKPCENGGTCIDGINNYTCKCVDGYTGHDCEINIDECSTGPCEHGGTCIDGINNYTCTCVDGYTSHNCEMNIDECSSDPCEHGGTCMDGINNYTCTCVAGYTGLKCEINIDECSTKPCKHGGTCIDAINNYTCACVDGYTGQNCEINIDECSADPCEHGGTCIDRINNYTCTCVDGYTGQKCEINIDECGTDPCVHGGTCIDGINNYTCTCIDGYDGLNCEINIDECSTDPCEHGGTCIDGINNYTCTCVDGYTGQKCEINIDECSADPCAHGGTCIDGINNYTCTCSDGFTGVNCEINIDECSTDPCGHVGTCIDGINNYTCKCVHGYTGLDCEINIDECSRDPCEHGGTCIDGINSYTCTCVDGYTGVNCEININECTTDPCGHSGTCIDGINNYTCTCVDGYSGRNCEIDIDECSTDPCEHGGTCIDGINNYTCTCVDGYTGRDCEINIDECGSDPCENGGTCIDGINNYTCTCVDGYTGFSCEINIDECSTDPCEHGGTCTDATNSYTCSCVDGYTGNNCEIMITTTTSSSPATSVIATEESSTTTTMLPTTSITNKEPPTTDPSTTQISTLSSTTTSVIATEESSTTTTMLPTTSITTKEPLTTNPSTTQISTLSSTTTSVITTEESSTTTTSSVSQAPNIDTCVCVHGKCYLKRCICYEGWSGETCAKSGGSQTHPNVKTGNDKSPPAFTEFVIPQTIPCKINEYCTIILPFNGKPGTSLKVEHGRYDSGLLVKPVKVDPKPAFSCVSHTKCPYEAAISVSPTDVKLYKYCVQTKDYQNLPADELCYQIQGIRGQSTHKETSIFVYPPTLPENSTMNCSQNQTCHYQLEVKKNKNGTCHQKLKVDPTTSSVIVHLANSTNSNSCRYDVVYIPSTNISGKQDLCFSVASSLEQRHCMVVDVATVKDTCDTKKASEKAREMVTRGYASCFCIVNSKKVQVIKKRPVVQKQKLFKAAGFGAGGMAGTMVVGVVAYAVVNKIRQPPEKRKPQKPRPKSRIHPHSSRE